MRRCFGDWSTACDDDFTHWNARPENALRVTGAQTAAGPLLGPRTRLRNVPGSLDQKRATNPGEASVSSFAPTAAGPTRHWDVNPVAPAVESGCDRLLDLSGSGVGIQADFRRRRLAIACCPATRWLCWLDESLQSDWVDRSRRFSSERSAPDRYGAWSLLTLLAGQRPHPFWTRPQSSGAWRRPPPARQSKIPLTVSTASTALLGARRRSEIIVTALLALPWNVVNDAGLRRAFVPPPCTGLMLASLAAGAAPAGLQRMRLLDLCRTLGLTLGTVGGRCRSGVRVVGLDRLLVVDTAAASRHRSSSGAPFGPSYHSALGDHVGSWSRTRSRVVRRCRSVCNHGPPIADTPFAWS